MALSSSTDLHSCDSDAVCTIIPNFLLENIADSPIVGERERHCAYQTLVHTRALQVGRLSGTGRPANIIPSYVLQGIIDSPGVSEDARRHAEARLAHNEAIWAARAGKKAETPRRKRLFRVLYHSEGTSELPGDRIRIEGEDNEIGVRGHEVWYGFAQTFNFYFEVFNRNSLDDYGMSLIGSIHYGKDGFDNAFFDGQQMVFGDGDGVIFRPFTESLEVIAHELTHGVIGLTANLPYHQQSGALNESISDVFGSMVKQYTLSQKASDADWLIGEALFEHQAEVRALRDMKNPGTAYDSTIFGRDK